MTARKKMLVTAESCTGGLIASLMTELPGSSSVFERGFVAYSNDSKHELLFVEDYILTTNGAVSEDCAKAMAEGALENSHAQFSISVTGIAGPGGGSTEKPVGLVYIGIAQSDADTKVFKNIFEGGRGEIRKASVIAALSFLKDSLRE